MLDKFFTGSELKKDLIKDSGIIYASNFISIIFRFLLTFFLARGLGPSKFGLIQLAISTATLISILIDIRIGEAVTKFIAEYEARKEKSNALSIVIIGYCIDVTLGIISFAAIYLTASLVANLILKQPFNANLIRVYSFAILFGVTNSTSCAIFQAYKKFKQLGLIQIINSILLFIFPVLFISFGLEAVMLGYAIAHILSTLYILISVAPFLSRTFKGIKPSNYMNEIKKIVPFSAQTFISVSFKSLNRYLDVIILGYFTSTTQVGYYKIAQSFCGVLGILASPVSVVIYPTLSDLWARQERDLFRRLLKRVSKIMSVISIPTAAAMLVLAHLIITLTVGNKFLSAIPAIYIIIWAVIMANIFVWLRPASLSIGRPEISTKANMLMSLLIVVLSLLFVPLFGFKGSAIAYLVTYIVGSIYMLLVIRWTVSDKRLIEGG